MTNQQPALDDKIITVQELSHALGRSAALIHMIARSFDIQVRDDQLSLSNAVNLIRCLAGRKGDQDDQLLLQNNKLQAAKDREFELAVALEIIKRERTALEAKTELLQKQLEHANSRSDRLEAKLHDLTDSLAHLVSQRDRLFSRIRVESSTSIRQHRGRDVLYLEHPVNPNYLG